MLNPKYLLRHPITNLERPREFRRLLNASFSKFSQLVKLSDSPFFPFTAVVEPTNICNLSCPLCFTGQKIEGRKKGYMEIATAERIAEQLGPYLLDVELDNWGEAFLHPKIFEIIKIFKSVKVHTAISSNLCIKNFNPEGVIESGLDLLIVSMDAARESTYLKYRVGGDFHLVLDNIRKLVETKKKMKRSNPYILLKFLIFPHNVDEREEFKKLANSLECDNILFWQAYYPKQLVKNYFKYLTPEQISLISRETRYAKKKTCFWPWAGVTINYDGSISVCCAGNSYFPKYDLGNINEQDFEEIWHNSLYKEIREVFKGKKPTSLQASPCWSCWNGEDIEYT